ISFSPEKLMRSHGEYQVKISRRPTVLSPPTLPRHAQTIARIHSRVDSNGNVFGNRDRPGTSAGGTQFSDLPRAATSPARGRETHRPVGPLFLTGSITRSTDLTPPGSIVPGALARRTSLRAIDRKAWGQTLNALPKRDVQVMLEILSLLGSGCARAS